MNRSNGDGFDSGALPRIVLVEDEGWERLRPLTWLRSAADLVVGAWTIRERWERIASTAGRVPAPCRVDALCRPHVAAIDPTRGISFAAPSVAALDPARGELCLWVRDRWVPDETWAREALGFRKIPSVWKVDGRSVALLTRSAAPAGIAPGGDAFWDALAGAGSVGAEHGNAAGVMLTELSDLIRTAGGLLVQDMREIIASTPALASCFGDGVAYAPEQIRIGDGCRIDHGAVLDARDGPIVIGPGTKIAPGTWVRGPFLCRRDCILLGGTIGEGSFLGPRCRVRGELEASTFLGRSNKAHDGFVGHSYIGEWVNLGALTTTSDLKNNYGPVHLEIDGRHVETKEMKVGSFIGDHAKTRIGTMLNTGSVIGLAANLFGDASLFPKWVPDFAWGIGPGVREYAIDKCIRTAETVMTRRGEKMTPALAEAIGIAFRESRGARERAGRQTT
jgi:UDP-N-acetylglucosamine diphosphorylase / glucose-1-phosphate thymidylyltransferase / UDP-N-acetylgalactosamine diphosphorylase / glucosamine-1-phosphate N-acetyltransferase / galactosamine-1-phosphate N-acetyltransferase